MGVPAAERSGDCAENRPASKPFAVRLRIEDRPLRFHDMVRGPVEFAAEVVSDPILVRSATSVEGRLQAAFRFITTW